jgi:hypothetical protein
VMASRIHHSRSLSVPRGLCASVFNRALVTLSEAKWDQ